VHQFTIEKALPPVTVSIDLVRSLPSYLSSKASSLKLEDDDEDTVASAIKISIEEESGEETFNSLTEYAPSKFPDTTKSITVNLTGKWGTGLKGLLVTVRLHKDRDFSKLKISYEATNAREFATGIAQGIMDCLAPHHKGWGWLHPNPFLGGALSVIPFALLLLLIKSLGNTSTHISLIIGIALFLTISYTLILPKLRTYTEFESRATDNKLKWWDWTLKGIIGFILFSIILSIFKDWLLALISGG
jgi:hypothetical protein